MTPRDTLIEAMARAAFYSRCRGKSAFMDALWDSDSRIPEGYKAEIIAALAALEARGCVVVPNELTDGMINAYESCGDIPTQEIYTAIVHASPYAKEEA